MAVPFSSPRAAPRSRPVPMTVGQGIVFALFGVITALLLGNLWRQWRGDASLSHGPLLLFIALGLLWLRKNELLSAAGSPVVASKTGFVLFVSSALLNVFAVWADVAFLKPLSGLGLLIGGVCFLWGRPAGVAAGGALGLLAWAIPWPTTLISALTFPLQLMSSAYAALFAGALGLSIHREGVHLSVMPETGHTPVYSILVAAQCSGLTSLTVLLALGYLIAYFTPARLLGKFLLVAAVVPLALLANAVRLTIILLVGGLWSAGWAGWVHDNEQPVLVFLCSFGLLGLRQLIPSWLPKPAAKSAVADFPADFSVDSAAHLSKPAPRGATKGALPVAATVLTAVLISQFWAYRTNPIPTGGKAGRADYLQSVAPSFRNWRASDQALTVHEWELLMPDAVLIRHYQSPTGEAAEMAVLAGHRKQTVHTPAFCMAGGGWNTLSETNLTIKLGDKTLPAVRAEMENHGSRLLMTYFFTDGTHSEQSLVRFQVGQFLGRLSGQPQVGALVRIIVPITSDNPHAAALSDDFARAVLPPVLERLREVRRVAR